MALVLSFLVFLVWSLLFGPEPKKTQEADRPTYEADEAKPTPKEEPIMPDPKTELVFEHEKDFEDITVETDLYIAVLSGSGPIIKSFKLKITAPTLTKTRL